MSSPPSRLRCHWKEKKRRRRRRRRRRKRKRKDKILTLTRGTRHELNKYLYGVLQTAPTPRSSPLQIIWRYLRAPCNKPAARSICRPRYPMGRSEKWKKYETKITFGSRYLCWKKRKKEKNKRNNSVKTCWQSISFHVSLSVKKKNFLTQLNTTTKQTERNRKRKTLTPNNYPCSTILGASCSPRSRSYAAPDDAGARGHAHQHGGTRPQHAWYCYTPLLLLVEE